MTYFTLIHNDGSKNTLMSANKQELIKEHFGGDESSFKQDVQYLLWTVRGISIREDINTGTVERKVVGADLNPYGWRG